MIRIVRTAAVSLAAAAGLVLGSATASTGGAQHDVYVESYDGSFHLSASENPCGRWGVTIREIREGRAKIVTPPGGREPGEYHVNGVIHARIHLVPDNPRLPTYTGTYREKLNAVITGVDDHGEDVVRVGQYRLRAPMTGSDGSRLVLALSGKVTLDAKGRMVVSRDATTCD